MVKAIRQTNHPEVKWNEQGTPYSVAFEDHYFSLEDGLNESLYVFCQGNQLKQRFSTLPQNFPGKFTIAETGFGTGLNFICAWQLWQKHAPANWMLEYFSIEHFPMPAADIEKAHQRWPELENHSRLLLQEYQNINSSLPIISFDQGKVQLKIVIADVWEALDLMLEKKNLVDVWFLDGFAPSRNPQMWSEEVFSKMAYLSKEGTTFSTYSSAGAVRRGLGDQGFIVSKVKGFGKKHQMLKGYYKA